MAIAISTQAAELIPSLQVGQNSYSNVMVREVAERSVTISHTRGMATLSIDKMTRKEKENLRLIEPLPEAPPKVAVTLSEFNSGELTRSLRGLDLIRSPEDRSRVATQAMQFAAQFETPEGVRQLLQSVPPPRLVNLVAPLAAYLLLSMCFVVICAKAGKPSPVLAWLPVLQAIPLFRAAKMSPFWAIALIVNTLLNLTLFALAATRGVSQRVLIISGWVILGLLVIHAIGWIIWSFKISAARGKSPFVGFLLLLPGINLLALVYLTASNGGNSTNSSAIKPQPKLRVEPVGLRLL
ncbi:MAG TPA: hypothetical protein VK530_09615 [Candidatus Acidoferrum sp.]|nr:hypothetical protein [Candidatus Acidoferrum sp.]